MKKNCASSWLFTKMIQTSMLRLWFCVMSESGFAGNATHWKIQDCWTKQLNLGSVSSPLCV